MSIISFVWFPYKSFSIVSVLLFRKTGEQFKDLIIKCIFFNRSPKKIFLSLPNNGIDTAPGGIGAWRFNIPILRFFCF